MSASASNGLLVEYVKVGTLWQSNLLAVSQGPRLNVLGVTPAGGLLLNLTTNGVIDGAFSLTWQNPSNSTLTVISTNASSAGPQAAGIVPGFTPTGATIRSLDSGVTEVTSGVTAIYKDAHLLPTGVVTNLDGGKLYFVTPSTMAWSAAQGYARSFGGDLIYIGSAAENQYLLTNVAPAIPSPVCWIGLHITNNIPNYSANYFDFRWVSGEPVNYIPPNSNLNYNHIDPGGDPFAAYVFTQVTHVNNTTYPPGVWATANEPSLNFGVCQVLAPWQIYSNNWMFQAPVFSVLSGTRVALTTAFGTTNGGGQSSVFFRSYIEDSNSSSVLDKGDSVVIEEFILSTNTWQRGAVMRSLLNADSLRTQSGFTLITNLDGSAPQVAIAEPDGTIRVWSKLGSGYTNGVLFKTGSDVRWQCLNGVPQP
ncbi:MAG: C-type lectin domain-containing protein, partial [Nitrosomonadaceae bacterium]|nr:C-type lectin domain-containing protein [Nitrosomonadaceae bacterium]